VDGKGCALAATTSSSSCCDSFRRFGQFAPRLIDFLKGLPVPGAPASRAGWGDDDTKSWFMRGLPKADGLASAAAAAGRENRSQRSIVGSARGVLRTWTSLFLPSAGVAASFAAGDDTGDELLARRFRALRGSIGDIDGSGSQLLSWIQVMRSEGGLSWFFFVSSDLPNKSCHVGRAAGAGGRVLSERVSEDDDE